MEDMGDMKMSMTMTFSSLWDYEVTILWDFWSVSTRVGYFISLVVVVLASFAYHRLKHGHREAMFRMAKAAHLSRSSMMMDGSGATTATTALSPSKSPRSQNARRKREASPALTDDSLSSNLLESSGAGGGGGGGTFAAERGEGIMGGGEGSASGGSGSSSSSSSSLNRMRLACFAFSASSYACGLLLMLVAMTYNSGLFLALVLGYAAGDVVWGVRGAVPLEADDHCH